MSIEVYLLVLFVAVGLTAQAALIEYSRSRLEKYCNQRNKNLLGKVFQHDDDAERAFRCWTWLALAGLIYRLWFTGDLGLHDLAWWARAQRIVLAGIGIALLDLWVCWPLGKVLAVPIIYWGWPFMNLVRLIFVPVTAGANLISRMSLRLAGEPENGRSSPIQEEILTVVNEGEREGAINHDAADMIEGLMELHEVAVSEIMTPRTDMVMLKETDTIDEARRVITEAGHSRIPVYGKTRDDIRGVLYAKDLLPHLGKNGGASNPLTTVKLREPVYVPESKAVNILLREFQIERVHIAIVLDEYGGVAGLVTIEDIIEEIVGEIDDEYDPAHKPRVKVIDDTTLEVDARVHVDEINELLPVELPEDADYDTIGGFLFSELGRVPKVGESLHYDQAMFTVLDATDRAIGRVRIELQANRERVESTEPTGSAEA